MDTTFDHAALCAALLDAFEVADQSLDLALAAHLDVLQSDRGHDSGGEGLEDGGSLAVLDRRVLHVKPHTVQSAGRSGL